MAKKLRILNVVASPFPSNQGTAGATRELVTALANKGHEIHIVTYYQGQNIDLGGINIHRIPRLGDPNNFFVGFNFLRPILDFVLIFKTLYVALKVKPHIIHSHHHEGVFASFFTRLITKIPTIYHSQSLMEQELPLYLKPKNFFQYIGKFLDDIAPKMADYSLAVSRDLADQINGKFENTKCTYLPLAIDYEIFTKSKNDSVSKKYDLNEMNVVLYTGVVDEFQGIDKLLNSLVSVLNKVEDAILVVAAPISNKNQINKYKLLSKKLGILEKTLFIEDLPFKELPGILSMAKVVVIPRDYCPGFPIKLLNYIASKKPIVAMKGSSKILEDGKSGMVAENYEDFSSKIIEILLNPKLSQNLVNEATLLLDDFAPEKVSEEVEKIYLNILNNEIN